MAIIRLETFRSLVESQPKCLALFLESPLYRLSLESLAVNKGPSRLVGP